MISKFRIEKTAGLALRMKIQKASGLNQRVFDKEIGRDAELKIISIIQKVDRAEAEDKKEGDRFVLPQGLNPEEHLFDLAFQSPGQALKVIDHAFREYSPEYGYWKAIPEESLQQRTLTLARKAHYPDTKKGKGRSLGTIANVRKTLDHAAVALFSNSLETNNTHLIAFRNGTVSTKTGELSDHNPDFHITSGLPYDYRQGAECPEPMQRYIASSFGAENMEYVRAGLGLMLDLTAKDKFIHAIGPSGSGKGVLTRLIMKFFGAESVGSPNNFKLFANPDQVHQYLSGKRLIAIDDIVGYVGEEIGRFYTAVERTAMNARCLFKPKGYTQQFDIRYIVASTGQLPTKYSNSKGWERRVFPMPTIARQEPDNNLERELELCIADIISWVLAQDKAQRNAILEHPERFNPLAEEYFIEAAYSSSSAWAFIEECLKPVTPQPSDTKATQQADIAEIYESYKSYCLATGRNAVSLDNLKHELKQAIPANYIGRKRDGDRRIPAHFVYIKTATGAFTKNDYGVITCNTSNLSYNGVTDFREWTRQYGHSHPYNPESPPTVTSPPENGSTNVQNGNVTQVTPECNEPVTQSVVDDTKQGSVQAVQGDQPHFDEKKCVCVDTPENSEHTHTQEFSGKNALDSLDNLDKKQSLLRFSNPEGLTVTWGLTHEQQAYERALLQAETLEELNATKVNFSKEIQFIVMERWKENGQHELLKAKVERLKNDALE